MPGEAIPVELVRTDRMTAACETRTRTRITSRRLTMLVDEPEDRGGTGAALSPTETMMGALLGCVNVVLNNVAARHGVDREVRLNLRIISDATPEELEAVKMAYCLSCPVTRMVRTAATRIVEHWTVSRRKAPDA